MNKGVLTKIDESEKESADLDFKSAFDPSAPQDWCELIKDIVAMANSGGGLIVFGVSDDGSPATIDLKQILALDQATIVDKIEKYTGQHFADFSLCSGPRRGCYVAVLSVSSVPIPIVFTAPGTYDIGGGKQKTAFSKRDQGDVHKIINFFLIGVIHKKDGRFQTHA